MAVLATTSTTDSDLVVELPAGSSARRPHARSSCDASTAATIDEMPLVLFETLARVIGRTEE